MVKMIFVKKSGTIKCSNVSINSLDNLYKKCGFKITGERTNYYKDGSSAIIQWLKLNN